MTGASAGVGRATAVAFARQGAAVGLLARGRAGLDAAAGEVERAGGRAHVVVANVSDANAVERAAAEVEAALGPIDVWVNNAMVSLFSPVHATPPDEYARVTAVTYLGTVHGTLAALRRMRSRDRGVIVQVGSALAFRSIPLQSAYCAAKHAVEGFTESLRTELLHDRSGVRVTSVHLPALNTPQFDWVRSRLPGRPRPVPPIYQPEVAARAIVRAAARPRRAVWVANSTFLAILADRLVPALADRYLAANAYDQQHDDAPIGDRPDNLYAPLEALASVHGRFDSESRRSDVQLALARVPWAWLLGVGVVAALLSASRRRSARRHEAP